MLVITTERCKLEPLEMSDAVELHFLWTLPEVRKFLWDDKIIPLSKTEEIIDTSIHHLAKRKFGIWGVYLLEADGLIGFGGYWPLESGRSV